ncbi:MAG: hypothetical protein RBU29_07745 [bacterium]|jgi:hypothetical protein|nr:hypothetical protein [bacterium]
MKKVGGVKAKRMLEVQDANASQKGDEKSPYLVLIISPIYSRIALFLKDLFRRNNKWLECVGVDLYRKALYMTTNEESKRVIALIITDRPEDHSFAPAEKLPLWQDTILRYQRLYVETHQKEVEEKTFPPHLTVITMFKHKRGILNAAEIESIEKEFESLQAETPFIQRQCESEEEIQQVLEQEIVESVAERARRMENIKKFTRTRSQKLAKAIKVTSDATKRALRGLDGNADSSS